MTAKLWSKGYTLNPTLDRFGAARNANLDGALLRHDLWGSLAHARMLFEVGLLHYDEWQALDDGLRSLLAEAGTRPLQVSPDDEDIHTAVEQALVARVGAPGKQLHIGRSRNDQALLDLRLYAKEQILAIADAALDTAAASLALARRYEWTPMPGYTHMQRAMLSSVGLWAAAHAEALLDDCGPLTAAYTLNDQSPLGSAAAYGAPLPLDRERVAELLGFARVHHNVLTSANARGKLEASVVQALALIMLDLSKWAQDVLLFTTSEFGFFSAPDELYAGSSIMPQKRNLDALELVRARAHSVIALQGQMLATLAGLPSGYNMDYQETKAPLMDAARICQESLEVVALYANRLIMHEDRLCAACSAELFATDHAYELTRAGVPFRDAYKIIAADPAAQASGDLLARLRQRASTGAPGNLQLDQIAARITEERIAWTHRALAFTRATDALAQGAYGQSNGTKTTTYHVAGEALLASPVVALGI